MDVFSKKKRSNIMSKIRGKNTLLERGVFSHLRKRKIYFQTHYSRVPGTPDIAIPSLRRAVFLDGGFWHGWGFKKSEKKLSVFWREKIDKNIKRDRRTRGRLKAMGWRVFRVWDHQLKKSPDLWLVRIEDFLRKTKE